MQNHLKDQTSPYLLQHADNPVNWYPWCEEAFARAKREDKPVFLSIGYSTCHWCHVMAHESFEDGETAAILNQYFISVKVDKEERPDIDSIYMSVCQALTGSGGWPTTIFLTPNRKPFYAGTYFPRTAKFGQPGLMDLLLVVAEKWESDRAALLSRGEALVSQLKRNKTDGSSSEKAVFSENAPDDVWKENAEWLLKQGADLFRRSFDTKYGGFGSAPKFPTPHNLLFLMRYYEKTGEKSALEMAVKTLLQMYKGGIFDHIGGGFSRYSTDSYFLVPHFEKMLYDNGLLILAYCRAYEITKLSACLNAAERTASFILREMTSPEGGFYSAQDADSEGVEGKYYLFTPQEIINILGQEAGRQFNEQYDITEIGNFEGMNIPNLLKRDCEGNRESMEALYQYRKQRYPLHADDKILTSWNGLMVAAFCHLYRITGNRIYLDTACRNQQFILDQLCEGNTLYVSWRKGKRSGKAFLEDYANQIFGLLALYEACYNPLYLQKAKEFSRKAIADFWDDEQGGFFLYGAENEQLILRPKETYDGAIPSGNSMMAYNLVRMDWPLAKRQLQFLAKEAKGYPAGYTMFLLALWDAIDAPDHITVVKKPGGAAEADALAAMEGIPCKIPLNTVVRILEQPTEEYPLVNDRITFYVCSGHSCQPPVNDLFCRLS